MKTAIVGGGIMGLALAKKLSDAGNEVHVFEKNDQLGGLATYHNFGDFFWDRFYHVILPADQYLLSFLRDIGMEDALRWKKTLTGYYVNEKFYSISNSKEFLLFPPLSMFSKFRLALTILYASRIKDWKKMEKISIEEWLVKVGGRATFEKFWKPLLLAKLGENYKRVSAVFIWTYIKRLFEARDTSAKSEQMGYVSGGYKAVFDQVEHLLTDAGNTVKTDASVEKIAPVSGSSSLQVTVNGQTQVFDKVIFTSPVNVLEQIVDSSLYHMKGKPGEIEYLGVLCMILVTKREISPYYVLNLADQRIPFTGVIGMSTLVDTAETGGYHLTYLPKYILSTDPLLRKPDQEIKDLFMQGVKTLYPDLMDEEIVDVQLNRAFKVQPLQFLNYSEIVPSVKTQHPDFYILNTSQFVHDTLNNNSVTQHVEKFFENFKHEFTSQKQTVNI